MFQTGRGSTPAAQPSPVPRVALKAWPKPAPEPQGWTGPSSRPEASVPGLAPRRCQLGRKRSAVGETQPPGRAASCFMGVQSTRGEVQRPDWWTKHVWWSLSVGSGGWQPRVTRLGNGRCEALGTKQASDSFLRAFQARGVCRSPPLALPPSGSPRHVQSRPPSAPCQAPPQARAAGAASADCRGQGQGRAGLGSARPNVQGAASWVLVEAGSLFTPCGPCTWQ